MGFLIKNVTAPLSIKDMGNINSNIIYNFDYENSSFDGDKPLMFMNYLENVGFDSDITVSENVSYLDKERLILLYASTERYFKLLTMSQTILKILFVKKELNTNSFTKAFLSDKECRLFISANEDFVNKLITFFDSLFVAMLLLANSSETRRNFKSIRKNYSLDKVSNEHISANICSIIMLKQWQDYYRNGIDRNNILYYDWVFNNLKLDKISFLNLISNPSNELFHLLESFHNKDFMDWAKHQMFN